jgi:hypothetical protein
MPLVTIGSEEQALTSECTSVYFLKDDRNYKGATS